MCKLCKKTFGDHHTFKVHKLTHENNTAHCCSDCPLNFTSKEQLKTHMRSHGDSSRTSSSRASTSDDGISQQRNSSSSRTSNDRVSQQRASSSSSSTSQNRTSGLSRGRAQMPSSQYRSGYSSAGRSGALVNAASKVEDDQYEVEHYSQIRIM